MVTVPILSHPFLSGETPDVVASPSARFDYWEGDVDAEDVHDESIGVIMNANKSLTAHFKPDVTLTIAKEGVGDVNPGVGVHTFIRDHVASVSASPANGFDHWEGDLEEDDNPNNPMQVVELTQSKSLTAVFKPMYTLTMAREGDGGTVSPGVGPHEYRSGESASLSAFGNDEWLFTEWSGDVSGTLPLKTLVMDGNKSATAHFIQAIKITVNKVGQGSVSPGTGVYPKGGTRTFTATPATGWRWDHWEGVPSGQEGDPSVDLPMDQSRTITAHFVERAKLTVVKELIGNLPADGGAVSPGEGVHEYDKGEVVNLSATADSGWRFKQWSGGASGTNASTTVTMSGDKTVTATFIQRHTITTTAITRGIVTPETGTWDHGQSASFVWEKESNFCFCQFSHWAGLPASFTTTEWGAGTSDQTTVNFTVNDSYHLDAYDENSFAILTTHVNADGCNDCAVDPAPQSFYLRDTPATVTATPGAGWGFVRWEGDVPEGMEEDNPLKLLMDEDKDVTAVFGQVTLTMDTEEGGTVDPDVGVYYYAQGDSAIITATAHEGWKFAYWDGDVPSEDIEANPLNLEMNEDKEVTAVFHVNLLVTQVAGATVDTLLGLNWGIPGWGANLQSTPDPGYEVGLWKITKHPGVSAPNGNFARSGIEPEEEVQYLTGEDVFYSVFEPSNAEPVPHLIGSKLLLIEDGIGGYVDVDYDEEDAIDIDAVNGFYLLREGAHVTVEGVADEPGYVFDQWEGEITPYEPEANPLNLIMDRDRHLTASFKTEVALKVDREGRGMVTVDPPNVLREPSFTETYAVNMPVTLTATTDDCGWAFDHWEGSDVPDDEEGSNPLDITMDDDKRVKAVFLRSGEHAKIELSVMRPSKDGVNMTHNGDDIPADQVFEPIITVADQIYMNGIVTVTDSDYELVGAKMELQGHETSDCTSTPLATTGEELFDGCTTKDLYATDHTPPNFRTLVIPSGVADLTTYRIVIYAKVRNMTSGAESWDSIYDTVAFTHNEAVDVAHTIAGEEKSIFGYKEVAKSIKARWTFPYMKLWPWDFSRRPGKGIIRGANQIRDVARNPEIYNAAGKIPPGLIARPQEARVEAASVLEVGGDKDHPAPYIEGGTHFFANDPAQRYEPDGTMNKGYRFILDAVAQGLLSKNATQGNEYFYPVGPTWWTQPFLKSKYDADLNDSLK